MNRDAFIHSVVSNVADFEGRRPTKLFVELWGILVATTTTEAAAAAACEASFSG